MFLIIVMNLEQELASLRFTVEKHRVTNKSLKRMKVTFLFCSMLSAFFSIQLITEIGLLSSASYNAFLCSEFDIPLICIMNCELSPILKLTTNFVSLIVINFILSTF